MSNQQKNIKKSIRNIVFTLILLLLTNIVMALTLASVFKRELRTQMNQRMLDIANTAAAQINGDELERLTAADMGTEEYERVLGVLRSFQKNIELDYIYGIRDNGNGTFSFTIDPSSQDPGEFNEPVVATQALKTAATGTPSVDQTPYADNWGRFYSAYSPVFDSRGEIAGIVGVDFNADRYDSRIGSYRTVSLILLIAVLSIGIVLAVLLIHLY